MLELARVVRARTGELYKVLPTAVFAASMRPSITRRDLETRGIVVAERGRFRVRERTVLRYYARTIEHLLATPGRTH